jgi:hypothetical protein
LQSTASTRFRHRLAIAQVNNAAYSGAATAVARSNLFTQRSPPLLMINKPLAALGSSMASQRA